MNKRNYIVLDTETSGRKPSMGHEVVQISARAFNCWNLESHEAGTFQALLKPKFPEKASDKAIQVIGTDLWEKAQKEGLDPKTVYTKFFEWVEKVNDASQWISKPILVGHNVSFDINFLTYWSIHYKVVEEPKSEEDEPEWPWSILPLDTRQLAYALFESDPTMMSFNLDSCLEKFGIARSGDKHDAGEDTQLNSDMFIRILKFLRECKKRVRTK